MRHQGNTGDRTDAFLLEALELKVQTLLKSQSLSVTSLADRWL
jgi:hypothetical protein